MQHGRPVEPAPRLCRVSRLLIAGAAAACLIGCQAERRETGPVRGVWVTRFDYKTGADVARIMGNCQSAGFNTVLFQVRGNGTVSYRSTIEPWSRAYGFRDPGFDPLAIAVREAHRRGLALHAWVNVMPGWQGPGPPPIRNQLYHAHPEWFWYDAHGQRQPITHAGGGQTRDWYVSLNPCLPEVRAYIVRVLHELVSRYDIDGLHLDYMRFPNEPVVPGEQVPDYPRDHRTLALFRQATGQTPETNPAAWNRWRTAQVTRLVADLQTMVKRTRPDLVLSAAVGPDPSVALRHFQDGRAWLKAGLVDAAYPMDYTPSVEEFSRRLDPWLRVCGPQAVVPGISVETTSRERLAVARRQIDIARARTGQYCLFAYASLFSGSRAIDSLGLRPSERNARPRRTLVR